MSQWRLILTMLVVWILSIGLGSLIHGFLLAQDYGQVAQLYRPATDTHFITIFIGYLAFAVGSVWLYSRGVEDKPWFGQGLRFGLAMWLVWPVASFLIEYATQPVPESLVVKQLAYELVSKLILGVVTAAMIRR
ncbi:MAG TPA: hypothetical protein VKF82_08705 [Candidatus Eremiobacteraceae bacterium]|nr:hypothetical protein [Candidatus Eremiobacteraceae bacterium]